MFESYFSILAVLRFMLISHRIVIANYYVTTYLQDSCRCKAIDELRCESFTLDLSSTQDHSRRTERSSGFVQLSRDPRDFGREFYCTFVIKAPPYMRVWARIIGLDLPPAPGYFSSSGDSVNYNPHRYVATDRRDGKTDGRVEEGYREEKERKGLRTVSGCMSSILQIYDASSSKDFRDQLIGICGNNLPQQNWFESSGSHLTLYYQHGPEVANEKKSFNLTFTLFSRRKNGCHDDEFQCGDDVPSCISFNMVCDGVENCLDGSDETQGFDLCPTSRHISDPLIGGIVSSAIFLSLVLMLVLSVSCNRRKNKPRANHQSSTTQQQQNDKSNDIEVTFEDDKRHDGLKVARSPSSVTYANLAPVPASTPTSSTERTGLMQTLPRSNSRRVIQSTPQPLTPSSPRQIQGIRKVTPRPERRNGFNTPEDVVMDSQQVLGTILGSTVRPIIIDAQTPVSSRGTPTEIQPTGTTLILYSNSINNIPLYSPRFLRHTEAKLLSPTHPPSYNSLYPESQK